MRILDRYLATQFLRVFIFSLIVFQAVYLIVDLFDRLSTFLDASGLVIIQYYFYRLPWVGFQVLPMAVLLASLLSLGTLARNNELLAMKMGRLSSLRIVAPLVILGVLISLVTVLLGESLIPRMNERALNVFRIKVKKVPAFQRTKDNDIWYRANDALFLHISLIEVSTGTVRGLTVFELSPDFQLRRRIDAREATWEAGRWLLKDGYASRIGPDGAHQLDYFAQLSLDLEDKPSDLARVVRESEEMNSAELREYIAKLVKSGVSSIRYQVDLAAKSSLSFASAVMALIGIAFALRAGKGGVMALAGACIVVGVSYWLLLSLSISLGRGGVLTPMVAAWLPNALFSVGGLTSVLTVKN